MLSLHEKTNAQEWRTTPVIFNFISLTSVV